MPLSHRSCRHLTHSPFAILIYLVSSPTHRSHHPPQHWASNPFRFDLSLTPLIAWLPGNEVADLPSAVAQFWQGQQLTWSVIARVDGKTYSLFGVPRPGDLIRPGSLTSADFSATHTQLSRRRRATSSSFWTSSHRYRRTTTLVRACISATSLSPHPASTPERQACRSTLIWTIPGLVSSVTISA
jgi:hypothetical protein